MKPKPKRTARVPVVEELLRVAKRNPWRLFTTEEIALLCEVSQTTLTAVRKREDSPFCAGKCRPERLIRWFDEHPGWQPSKE